MRSNKEILESHIRFRDAGKINEDIQTNYAEDIIIIDSHREYHCPEGVRRSSKILAESLPNAQFTYDRLVTNGQLGYLIWHATTPSKTVTGVDSFLIAEGKIKGQTIYYHT